MSEKGTRVELKPEISAALDRLPIASKATPVNRLVADFINSVTEIRILEDRIIVIHEANVIDGLDKSDANMETLTKKYRPC